MVKQSKASERLTELKNLDKEAAVKALRGIGKLAAKTWRPETLIRHLKANDLEVPLKEATGAAAEEAKKREEKAEKVEDVVVGKKIEGQFKKGDVVQVLRNNEKFTVAGIADDGRIQRKVNNRDPLVLYTIKELKHYDLSA